MQLGRMPKLDAARDLAAQETARAPQRGDDLRPVDPAERQDEGIGVLEVRRGAPR